MCERFGQRIVNLVSKFCAQHDLSSDKFSSVQVQIENCFLTSMKTSPLMKLVLRLFLDYVYYYNCLNCVIRLNTSDTHFFV